MDLDELQRNVHSEGAFDGSSEDNRRPLSPLEALKTVDTRWYAPFSRASRWMDLVGDYAGHELFVIDGDSLIQQIIDDPLLALAKEGDASFQSLHVRHNLERILVGLRSRHANFEVVFWQDHRHCALRTGASKSIVGSRLLARRILFNHVLNLDVKVHVFSSLSDARWKAFQMRYRPMFIMMNDGGSSNENTDDNTARRLLLQRLIIKDVLYEGMAVVLLAPAEFRDSKILTFVLEEQRQSGKGIEFPESVYHAKKAAEQALAEEEADVVANPQALQPTHSSNASLEEMLVTAANSFASHPDVGNNSQLLFLLKSFIAHLVSIEYLPMQLRAQPRPSIGESLKTTLLEVFFPLVFVSLDGAISSTSVVLDVDGHLFLTLVDIQLRNPGVPFSCIVGEQVNGTAEKILRLAGVPDVLEPPGFAPESPVHVPNGHAPEAPPSVSVLPFKNKAFEDILPIVEEKGGDVEASSSYFNYNRHFEDTRHWHGKRTILPPHQGGEAARNTSEWLRMKEMRKHMRNMNNMQKLAASLTGALGTQLQRKRILAGGKSQHSTKPKEKPVHSHQVKGKKGKEPPLKKADKIKAQNTTDKAKKEDVELLTKWSVDVRTMESHDRDHHLHLNMKDIDGILASKQAPNSWYDSEVRLYQIHTELRLWAASSDKDGQSTRDKFSVSILRKALELLQNKKVTKTILGCLESVFSALGFSSYFPALAKQAEERLIDDRRLEFKFVKLQKKAGDQLHPFMHIKEDPVEWQLRLFGEYMDRSMDGKEDGRVDFKPDGWQRKVLDCLDADESVLVVAPTSAGKTFISFYAMEKVLRDSDDGILVYIAPTKALVNQVAAEVYARFEKEVPGGSMWAIHTRDYRLNDPQKCQILVTVPEMFAIMLLSPPLAKVWTPRIKRVILDEIHTIGQQEGGAVWEQILLLAPCPVVGLSATIGSPEVFNKWLASVQQAHGFKHKFVDHPYRYSHLRKHIYRLPNAPIPFEGLSSSYAEDNIRFLHPVSALAFGTNTIPPDFSLEARDALSLYNALLPFESQIPGGLHSLDPKQNFRSDTFLRQKDIIEYEVKLKSILLALMSSPNDASRPVLGEVIKSLQDSEVAKISDQRINTAPSHEQFLKSLVHLVVEMHCKAALPAIFFSYDRSNCEIMAKEILDELTKAEDLEKESPKWRTKMKHWESWKAIQEKKQREKEKSTKKRTNDEDMRENQDASSSWEGSFDPSDPLPEFSFADIKRYSQSDLKSDIKDLRRSKASIPEWAFHGLLRGVAVHHSGMNKGYRNLIERLFRLGFLRVMFATGTLALGINAPAKSSVFCGDSPFLTALTYRQCAGRAGRRGFDLLGNVIFYGLPMDRVQRLILSRLPVLTGNFPLTSTLSLRLFNLLHGSQNTDLAVNSVRSLMQLPQISFGSASGRQQLAHHMRFSIEYLRRAGLLDTHGKPMNLYGIAAHLYYAEPSNLALVCLMRSGVLHRIAGQASSEQAKRDLMLVLCHLFGRRYLPQAYGSQDNVARLRVEKKYSSLIVLPPLPTFAREVLEEHNSEILNIFSAYARSYVSVAEASLGVDDELPLSKTKIGPSGDDDAVLKGSLLKEHLEHSAIKVTTRSLFIANSGCTDAVQNVEELARTCRRGLELNEHAIPSLTHITSLPSDDRPQLNAYLFDFYAHGQLEMLVTANGVRRGDVWYHLQDFDLTMKSIRLALEQLLLEASGKKAGAGLDGVDGELAALENDWENDDVEEDDIVKSKVIEVEKAQTEEDTSDIVSDWEEDTPEKRSQGSKHSMNPSSTQVGVSDADRRVFKLVNELCEEFSAKFRKIFA